jgi:hypothetical protein
MDTNSNSGSNYNSGSGYGSTNSGSNSGTMLTGMFADRDSAERAYSSLTSRGYNHDDINVVMSDEARKRHFANHDEHTDTDLGNKAMEGVGTGSTIGGTLGAIVGAVAAIGTNLLLPGLGLVVAGPLAGALAGAGAGGLTGGLIGGLVGHGIPEDRAKRYEQGVKDGHIVMGVRPRSDDDATYLENEWRQNNGQEVYR